MSLQFQVPTGQTVINTRGRSYTAVNGVVTVAEPVGTDIADLLNQGCVPLEGGAVTVVTASAPLASSGGSAPNLTIAAATSAALGTVRPDGTIITVAAGAITVAKASAAAFGVAEVDNTTIVATAGVLSIANGFVPQAAAPSGGPVVTTPSALASYGYTEAQADDIVALLNKIQAALVANGIMS